MMKGGDLQVALESGETIRVALCDCGHCENTWFVRAHEEHRPSYCPYCGIQFRWYTNDDGKFDLGSQQPVEG